MIRRPPRSTLFPYTTLFRSGRCRDQDDVHVGGENLGEPLRVLPGERRPAFGDGEERELAVLLSNAHPVTEDRKSTRLNSSHANISYAVFCLKKKKSINVAHQ